MAKAGHILVVEDDAFVQKALEAYLGREDYRVTAVDSGEAMRQVMHDDPPDLVIMDLKLPNDDGFELTRHLRQNHDVGIIILTSKDETIDRVVGLELGADDYVTKPWQERELLARIRSVMRRTSGQEKRPEGPQATVQTVVNFAGWRFNLDSRELISPDGAPVELTSSEYSLLAELVGKPGRVLSRDHLLDAIYNRGWEPYDRSIDVLVTRLRRKIERDSKHPEIVKTVRGTGYMFAASMARENAS